jgi:hypothetical protein
VGNDFTLQLSGFLEVIAEESFARGGKPGLVRCDI